MHVAFKTINVSSVMKLTTPWVIDISLLIHLDSYDFLGKCDGGILGQPLLSNKGLKYDHIQ